MRAFVNRCFVTAGLACAAWSLVAQASASSISPAGTSGAVELKALPGGRWLALHKQSVRLIDSDGAERARVTVRGKHLDVRTQGTDALAVLIEADTQRTLAISLDLRSMQMRSWTAIPSPEFSVEAMCQYRDQQGLDHVFLVGDEGLTQQWVLHKKEAFSVRSLALPPQTRRCQVDDANQRLFANQQDGGVWVFHAEAERKPAGHPVALSKPHGVLRQGATAVQVVGDALATVDSQGELRFWNSSGASWKSGPPRKLAANGEVKALAVHTQGGSQQLLWLDSTSGVWKPAPGKAVTIPKAAATLPIVLPRVQSQVVARFGDAADDPAIWVHPSDSSLSRVLGTNKKQGLLVYDLAGREKQLLEVGRVNNVDLRQRVRFDNQTLDLAVATHRDDLSIVVFSIDSNGEVRENSRVPTGLKEIYGLCLYQPASGGLEVFVNDKDGTYLRFRLQQQGPLIEGSLLQRFKVASQPEACVADDAAARLFVGEEKRGVWVVDLRKPVSEPAELNMALPAGGLLVPDTEGIGLYHGLGASYLVVSSQGNNSYVVADAAPPFKVRGAFRIGMNLDQRIDGVAETDGLEVTSRPLGAAFPQGALVVQDGFKRLPDGPQNFKIVAWEDIAAALGLH